MSTEGRHLKNLKRNLSKIHVKLEIYLIKIQVILMEKIYKVFALMLLLTAAGASSLLAQAAYVIRIVETDDRPESPFMDRMIQSVLKEIHSSNRVDILPATSTDGAATHLAEVSSSFGVVENSMKATSFNDSTAKIKFNWTYSVQGSVDLLITEVQTGKIVQYRKIPGKGNNSLSFEMTYKETRWVKTKNNKDEKELKNLETLARNAMASKASDHYNAAVNGMIRNATSQARQAPAQLFPFRLTVLEATETKKDKAETVLIDGGKAYDLRKNDRLVVYTVRTVTAGNKSFEHFNILGRIRYEADHERGGTCDVFKGKEKILTALQAGEKIWCRVGEVPYTMREAPEEIKVAISSFIVPKDVPAKTREGMYRRLRVQMLSRKGLTVLEREKLDNLNIERDLQKQEEFIDNAAVEQFKSVGAELIAEVKFLEPLIDVDREFMSNKVTGASVTSIYEMRLLDVETGEILNQRNGRAIRRFEKAEAETVELNHSKNTVSTTSLGRTFYLIALGNINFDVAGLVNEVFPPRISLAEVTEDKKNRAEEVLLVGDFNVKAFDKYYVMRKRKIEVDGVALTRFEQLGLVALRDDEGEGVANAKVKDGGEEIFKAMQAGEELFCIDKPNLLERMGKWSDDRMERYGY